MVQIMMTLFWVKLSPAKVIKFFPSECLPKAELNTKNQTIAVLLFG